MYALLETMRNSDPAMLLGTMVLCSLIPWALRLLVWPTLGTNRPR